MMMGGGNNMNNNSNQNGSGNKYNMQYGSDNTSSGPRAKCDQVVFEAFAKAVEIVVNSRCLRPDAAVLPQLQFQQQSYHMNGNGGSSSSSRFNLLVPEISGVRTILQRWRRALHVPLRLDVYYQHGDGINSNNNQDRKELLERWCLEYIPTGSDNSGASGMNNMFSMECQTSDPIVQLRHVCKKIVIWLRTLYCSSRLLPAKGFTSASTLKDSRTSPYTQQQQKLGFSIYFSHEIDDDTNLVHNQGFLSKDQPACVYTPYGKLQWKVLYAPREAMQCLLPITHPSKGLHTPLWMQNPQERIPSMSRPIPNANNNPNNRNQAQTDTTNAFPMSAPEKVSPWLHQQHHQQHQQIQQQYEGQNGPTTSYPPKTNQPMPGYQNTYHPGMDTEAAMRNRITSTATGVNMEQRKYMYHRASSDVGKSPDIAPMSYSPNQRRNSSAIPPINQIQGGPPPSSSQQGQPPERVFSGLSLALMDANTNGVGSGAQAAAIEAETGTDHTSDAAAAPTALEPSSADKRRAALHHPPPHVDNLKNSHQYGYAYNSHIPWQQSRSNHPANSPRHSPKPSGYDISPMNTPPSGALLADGTPPQFSLPPTAMGNLIPPRNQVKPPVAFRPVGFLDEPPKQQFKSLPGYESSFSGNKEQMSAQQQQPVVPPITSLDLLHSSPFQNPLGAGGGPSLAGAGTTASLLSSLSMAGTGLGGGLPDVSLLMTSASSDYRHASIVPPSTMSDNYPDEDQYNMPFAVDSEEGGSGGVDMLSSASVASFALKCTPTQQHRLKLFQSEPALSSNKEQQQQQQQQQQKDMVSSLADQLADFHAFGASLNTIGDTAFAQVQGATGDNDSSSTSTPIALPS